MLTKQANELVEQLAKEQGITKEAAEKRFSEYVQEVAQDMAIMRGINYAESLTTKE